MDEERIGTEVTEADLAAFDEDWGDGAAEEQVPQETPAAEETAGEAAGTSGTETGEAQETPADQPESTGADPGEPGNTEAAPAEGESEAGDQRFDLTYMQETRTVGREEVVRLAQKGMDYDRIRGRYDGLTKEIEELGGMETVREFAGTVQELAKSGGMTVEQALDTLSAGIIARRDNVGMDVARERARAERLQKAGEERKTREAAEKTKSDESERRRNEDLATFVRTYPKVEAKDIPTEVWAAVRNGQSLVTAYALYDAKQARTEADKLRAEVETVRKNAENRQKAAPTGQSAGNTGGKSDPFDEGWDD